ncbi:cytochrome P450 [Serendipita vermifera]|nr:cytochrome P450 [Serendipita vermifera]
MPGSLQGDLLRPPSGPLAAIALVSIVMGYYYMSWPKKSNPGVPISDFPGPKRIFLLGNALNFPKTGWRDVAYLELPRLRMLVINSLEDAEELLVKRANIWSGRPNGYFLNDLTEWGWAHLVLQPGHDFTEQRKIFRKTMGPQGVADYHQLIENQAQILADKFEGFSGDPTDLVFSSIGAVIVESAYGESVLREHGQELLKLNKEALDFLAWTFPQVWLPDILPLENVGNVFSEVFVSEALILFRRKLCMEVLSLPIPIGLTNLQEKGRADFSLISKYLNAPGVSADHLRDAAAMMYMGGVETTSSSLLIFLNHMQIYPDIQAKIHKEMDDKIGRGGTITYAEISSLKYFLAVWKESMRFNHPVPGGIIHVNTEDDVWKGYFIPKGTFIIPHIGFILRDPRIWGDDADVFKPERFLPECNPKATELPDVESLPFGFGRR